MDTDFRFACAECGFDCAGDGWDEYWNLNVKKEFVKILQKIFICHIRNSLLIETGTQQSTSEKKENVFS